MHPKKPIPKPLPCELIDDLFSSVDQADDLSAFEFVMNAPAPEPPASRHPFAFDDEEDALDQVLPPVDLVDTPTEYEGAGTSSTFMVILDDEASVAEMMSQEMLPQTSFDQELCNAPDGIDTIHGDDIDLDAIRQAIEANEELPSWYTL